MRPHAQAELRLKLVRRGHEPEEVEATVARYLELGYLDDGAFAEALTRSRSASRGARAIRAELVARGVERGLAEGVVGGLGADQQLAAATRLAARIGLGRPDLDAADRRRLLARLARRGFDFEVARAAAAAARDAG